MNLNKTRDIIFIICAVIFVAVYSISNLAPIFFPSWYYTQTLSDYGMPYDIPLNNYVDCTSEGDITTLTVTMSNYGKDTLEDIQCNIIDKAGLVASEDSQIVSSLTPLSSDICIFELEGKYKTPLRVEIKYGEHSIKQAVPCYPLI